MSEKCFFDASHRDVESIVRLIFEEFAASRSTATQTWKKVGRILKIVGRLSGNALDPLQLLIAVNDPRLTDFQAYWSQVEDRLDRELRYHSTLSSRAVLAVHTLTDVNRELSRGTKFFVDFIEGGLTLYDFDGGGFRTPRYLAPDEVERAARRHFNFWFPLSLNARELAKCGLERGMKRDAAFLLHQAAERAYHCALLTVTQHSPKTHRLDVLRATGEHFVPALALVWRSKSPSERRAFDQLREAYLGARYRENFDMSADELSWVDGRIEALQDVARIEMAVQSLPETTRDIFRMRRDSGWEYERISEHVGRPLAEVEDRISSALLQIANFRPLRDI